MGGISTEGGGSENKEEIRQTKKNRQAAAVTSRVTRSRSKQMAQTDEHDPALKQALEESRRLARERDAIKASLVRNVERAGYAIEEVDSTGDCMYDSFRWRFDSSESTKTVHKSTLYQNCQRSIHFDTTSRVPHDRWHAAWPSTFDIERYDVAVRDQEAMPSFN